MRHARLVSALVTLGVLVAWQAVDRQSPGTTSVAESATLARTVPAPQKASGNGDPQPPRAQVLPHPAQTEVCGLGEVDNELDESMKAAIGQKIGALAGLGRHEMANRLLGDPSAFAQATGLLVQYLAEEDDRRRAANGGSPPNACEGADCPGIEALAPASAQLADGLARQAIQTLDPRVYGLAYRLCLNRVLSQESDGNCSLLSPQQWSRIDPDNGAPWLYTLYGAASKNTPSVVDEALFQIAKATRYDDGFFATAAEIAHHASGDEISTLGAFTASTEAIGISAAATVPLDKLIAACRGAALADSNRRQLCEGVADTLSIRSSSLLMASIGLAIGRNLGWGPDRADALHGLRDALTEAAPLRFDLTRVDLGLSCSGIASYFRSIVREGVVGETGWAREWLAANGKTEGEYTQKAREARMQGEAKSQAMAASAAETAPTAIPATR